MSESDSLTQRLNALEEKVNRIERALLIALQGEATFTGAAPATSSASALTPKPNASVTAPSGMPIFPASKPTSNEPLDFTQILGIGGVAALVLAAAYLIRLAIGAGWLTPPIQVTMILAAGIAMIVGGFVVPSLSLRYRSLLPAGGVVVLYIGVYAAHLYYALIDAVPAAAGIAVVSGVALWLGTKMLTDVFVFFAVACSYAVPMLLRQWDLDALGVAVYFCAWGGVFSAYSVRVAKRGAYLLALHLGLMIYHAVTGDLSWRGGVTGAAVSGWNIQVGFQLIQLLLFAGTAVVFSVRHNAPMTEREAMMHAPGLLIFYFLQFFVLQQSAPKLIVPLAVGSALLLIAAYALARSSLTRSLPAAKLLVTSYCSLVALHAIYFESVPNGWKPWVGALVPLILLPIGLISQRNRKGPGVRPEWWTAPLLIAGGLIFFANYIRVMLSSVGAERFLEFIGLVYALELYGVVFVALKARLDERVWHPSLYAAHVMAMVVAVQVLENRLGVSVVWALLAGLCLWTGIAARNRDVALSSLLILGASTLKVLLFDLSGANPIVRILCLLILGLTLYGAGLLFQRLAPRAGTKSPNL